MKRDTFNNNNFGQGSHVNNNNAPPGPGGNTFTNNNFGFSGQTFVNNNNGDGRPGETMMFGNGQTMFVNNNGQGIPQGMPQGMPFNMNNNNNNGGMAGPGMTVVNNNNMGGGGGMGQPMFFNSDGTFVQPIYVSTQNGRSLVGYHVISHNRIVNTIFNPLVTGPMARPPGPDGQSQQPGSDAPIPLSPSIIGGMNNNNPNMQPANIQPNQPNMNPMNQNQNPMVPNNNNNNNNMQQSG